MRPFSLYSLFKDLAGFKLLQDWMKTGNNIEFTVDNPHVFLELIKFLSSIACRPYVTCDNVSSYDLAYGLHVPRKEEPYFKSHFKKWRKANPQLFI
jgi:hypothetical protein